MAFAMVRVMMYKVPYVDPIIQHYTIGGKDCPDMKALEKKLKKDKSISKFVILGI